MAQLRGFNARNVDPHTGFDPIPAGVYDGAIVDSAIKPTRNQKGQLLELVIEVLSGPYKGRKVWDNLMLAHAESDKAVEIGHSVLSAICRAVNVMEPRDTLELHNRPMRVSVGLRRREDGGDYVNVIRKYEPAAQPLTLAQGAAPGVSNANAKDEAPWKRENDGKSNALTSTDADEGDDRAEDDDVPI